MPQSNADAAQQLHYSGKYNCAQAVACAFAKEMGLTDQQAYKIMEGFGGGFGGTHDGVCGALSGATAVISYLNSDGTMQGTSKLDTYGIVAEATRMFEHRAESIICDHIYQRLGDTPCRCNPIVRIAAEVTEEILDKYQLR